MEEFIKEKVKEYGGVYIPIKNKKSLVNIYNYYLNGIIIGEDFSDPIECMYYGVLFNWKNDKFLAIKYWEFSAEKGNVISIKNLSEIYQNDKKYDLAIKYWKLGIEKGDTYSMKSLGHYYEHIEKNYLEMKKYYIMAIEKGDTYAMNNLAYYYQHIEKNTKLMETYYFMAIEKGNTLARDNLEHYYKKFNLISDQNDYYKKFKLI